MLRSKRFPTIGIANSQFAHRTPERQRQEDVWVNSGEDRVQVPSPVSKNVRKLPRSGLMCLPATARPRRTDQAGTLAAQHSEIQCVCNFLAAVENKTSHPSVRRAIKSINLITAATPAFMNYRALVKVFYHSAILLACITLSCRPQQAVIVSPRESVLVVLNGCVISACNYFVLVVTRQSLGNRF